MPAPYRHVFSIIALPVMVTVVIPWWILNSMTPVSLSWIDHWAVTVLGVLLMVAGLCLFIWTNVLFDRTGKGTLAPWDATHHLVTEGPYAYVRNPMITSVLALLISESLIFNSLRIAAFALLFFAFNHMYFILLEEPSLRSKYGSRYEKYVQNVRRWVPRLRAWKRDRQQ